MRIPIISQIINWVNGKPPVSIYQYPDCSPEYLVRPAIDGSKYEAVHFTVNRDGERFVANLANKSLIVFSIHCGIATSNPNDVNSRKMTEGDFEKFVGIMLNELPRYPLIDLKSPREYFETVLPILREILREQNESSPRR